MKLTCWCVKGLVTATQKVNRRACREKYEQEIKEAFKGTS